MSKFSDIYAEAVHALAGHGFADEVGTVEYGSGAYMLAEISPVILRNVGEDDIANRLVSAIPNGMPVAVLAVEGSNGFVSVVAVKDRAYEAFELAVCEYAAIDGEV